MECGNIVTRHFKCSSAEKPDDGHRWLLSARRERPHRDAANKRDELPPPHSITSSAVARDEALEEKTAISEVLRLVSTSSSNLETILQSVAERAAHICLAQYV